MKNIKNDWTHQDIRTLGTRGIFSPWQIGTLKYVEIEIKKLPSEANGDKLGPMGPNGTKRDKIGPNGAKWSKRGQTGLNGANGAK